jgi:phage FluMu protein gp41
VALLVSVAGIPTFILAAVGAILGHVALRQIKQSQQAGAGMAKGAIGIGWAVVGIELLVVCCAAAGAISGAFSVIHFLF